MAARVSARSGLLFFVGNGPAILDHHDYRVNDWLTRTLEGELTKDAVIFAVIVHGVPHLNRIERIDTLDRREQKPGRVIVLADIGIGVVARGLLETLGESRIDAQRRINDSIC